MSKSEYYVSQVKMFPSKTAYRDLLLFLKAKIYGILNMKKVITSKTIFYKKGALSTYLDISNGI
jgi:hypothetical protein